MGSNPIDPAQLHAFHVFMLSFYAIATVGFVYGVFGFVRTAATRLPVPRRELFYSGLFPLDIGPDLTNHHGKWRKVQKLAVYGGLTLLFGGGWVAVLYTTYVAGDSWFAWTPRIGLGMGLALHLAVLAVFMVPFTLRARSHANRFKHVLPQQ